MGRPASVNEGSTRQRGKLRKVVYTCVTAGYSVLPVRPQSGWDYVCFSEERIDIAGWRMQPIPADAFMVEHDLRPGDKAKTSKCIKLLPHRFLPDYDVSIWIDATLAFRPKIDLDALLDRFLASGKSFQVRAHPYRRCTYDEALQVHRNGKDTAANVLRLVEFLKQNRFPRNLGLTENNFLLRLHHDPRVIRFSERWWKLVQEFSRRDQLTFMFAAWREGLDMDIIDDRVDPSLERSSDGEARGDFFDATFEMHREVVPPFRHPRSARWYLRYYRARIAQSLLFAHNRAGDLAWAASEYRHRFDRWPNLIAPRTLTEALLRTRVFGHARDVRHARISDKEWAKDFIARRVGENLVVPTLAVLRSEAELRAYRFPEECVVKATHSPGDVQIVRRDGDGVDLDTVLGWLAKDPYAVDRDRSLRALTPKVIVEPLIVDDDGEVAMDCKVLCFAGVPAIVRVDIDRFGWRRNAFYSADSRWHRLPFAVARATPNEVSRPRNLAEMLATAATISKGFPFLRVDFLHTNRVLKVNGLTRYPDRCFIPYSPASADRLLYALYRNPGLDVVQLFSPVNREETPDTGSAATHSN
jgi:hypothetical protein